MTRHQAPIMPNFRATHEITITDHTGTRTTFPVHLVDSAAYTREEWDADDHASWEFSDAGWTFQGNATSLAVRVKKLGRGRTSRNGDPSVPVTVRATGPERARWVSAARDAGCDLSAWLRRAANDAARGER